METGERMQKSMDALAADISKIKVSLEAIDQIHATREQLVTRLTQAEDGLKQLRSNVEQNSKSLGRTMRNLYSAGAVVAALAGFLGWQSYEQIESKVETHIEGKLSEIIRLQTNDYYRNLLDGKALLDDGQYSRGTESLMKCFTHGHTYDTSLLVPLLSSIYFTDDWEDGKVVIETLKSNSQVYTTALSPSIHVLVGGIEVQGSLEHPDWLPGGLEDIQLGQRKASEDDQVTMKRIYENLWIYAVRQKDFKAAQDAIDSMKKMEIAYASWETIKDWRFFKRYLKDNPDLEQEVKAQWDQLHKSRSGSTQAFRRHSGSGRSVALASSMRHFAIQ